MRETKKLTRSAAAVLLGAALVLSACSGEQGSRLPDRGETTRTPGETTRSGDATRSAEATGTELRGLVAERALQEFRQLAEESGLFSALDELGPYTVFAPTNEALDGLSEAEKTALGQPENRGELAQLVAFHIVPGRWELSDMRNGAVLPTLSGRFVTVEVVGGEVVIGGKARLVEQSRESSAGVVYKIDAVLDPDTGSESPDSKSMTPSPDGNSGSGSGSGSDTESPMGEPVLPPGHPDISPPNDETQSL
ncbi:MAG TPA: fasciclin domain-containing protein [Coriobacteriia bacterium]|nr:fasciclin domain-containing protein [Coriobacteriia bacterium]